MLSKIKKLSRNDYVNAIQHGYAGKTNLAYMSTYRPDNHGRVVLAL